MSVCTITGTIRMLNGQPICGVPVKVSIKLTSSTRDGQVFGGTGITSAPIEAFTDEDGDFTIDILQGAAVNLSIPAINLDRLVTVPNTSTVDFIDLLD